jgi:hypothetical protein
MKFKRKMKYILCPIHFFCRCDFFFFLRENIKQESVNTPRINVKHFQICILNKL